ncbi:hypothetical protein BI49514_00825 [Brevibacterium iodinum ATCC 49514]|uniref:Uncharacterized protein n=1 Tax=Brevibacterium iodinum ATCC 49514 TaxID=1255616 RepID=A0A2H1IDB6_9MICO|nr:hypothetical protein [Brevibacterium iodinum]SMX73104.1 hypothetical protein BI49514_00825 [Brevibacterium iodinum ATCC 49514]SUW13106.1 Uncharacterised protein [Brevibacterium iodinum]
MTLTRTQPDGRLSSFAYGHDWKWEEPKYPWAFELQRRPGEASTELGHGPGAPNGHPGLAMFRSPR